MDKEAKNIFKTIKNSYKLKPKNALIAGEDNKEISPNIYMKKIMKSMKNRLSARKCRQKKKIYMKNLEEEIVGLRSQLTKYKSLNSNEMKMEFFINEVFILYSLI